jgi:hypothetical protein
VDLVAPVAMALAMVLLVVAAVRISKQPRLLVVLAVMADLAS